MLCGSQQGISFKYRRVSRDATLYSIVNSLVELPDINKVQFSIDGQTMKYFGDSDIIFDVPLERNLDLIKGEN